MARIRRPSILKKRPRKLSRTILIMPFAALVFMFSFAEAAEKEEPSDFWAGSAQGFGSEVNRDSLQLRRLFGLPAELTAISPAQKAALPKKKGWLGILFEEGESVKRPNNLNVYRGRPSDIPALNVIGVYPGSSAGNAGLLAGDKILAIDGDPLSKGADKSVTENFTRRIVASAAGSSLRLHILRGEELREVAITLTPKPTVEARLKNRPGLEPGKGPKTDSLLYRILKKRNLLGEFKRTAAAIRESASHVISASVKGKDYNPFRLREVNYLLSHPMDLPLVAAKMTASLEDQFRDGKPNLAGLIRTAMDELDLESAADLEPALRAQKEDPSSRLADYIERLLLTLAQAAKSREEALSGLTPGEIEILYKGADLLFPKEPSAEKTEQSDLEKKEEDERLLLFLNLALKVDLAKLIAASMRVARVLDIDRIPEFAGFEDIKFPADWVVEEEANLIRIQTPYGKVLLGGGGNNVYEEDALLIIDSGGNDVYLNNAGASARDYPFAVVIDFSGDDLYRSSKNFSQGSGFLGGGFLIDLAGDDKYEAQGYAQGSGFFGTGLLVDLGGNDEYRCRAYCQASGIFGVGLLIEAGGNDSYDAAIYSQGFGFIKGYGALLELRGDDYYNAGGVYPDSRQPDEAFLAMSQGFGYGLRPWGTIAGASGGIGVIADAQGDDTYIGDYFGQGASYWYALGILSDKKGNDKYSAGRYSQGAGVHNSAGILVDAEGNDEYRVHFGVSQGCGHDLAIGFLLDNGGDDRYTGGVISQGAGNGNGIGIFNDNGGNDEYHFDEPGQGSGKFLEFRQLGSFGVFFDTGGGDDQYPDGEKNGRIIYKNEWGIFADTK